MHELESRGETVDQKPFVIRGHHLFYFAWLLNEHDATPQRLAGRMISWAESSSGYILDVPASQRKQKEQEEKEYEEDVLGVDLVHANEFKRHLIQTFGDFLRLPDNYPAEIVEEVPDIICAGCAVGRHCRTIEGAKETRYLDALLSRVDGINYLRRLRGEDQLPELVIQKRTIFAVAAPNKRKIETTLGVVKSVLTRKPNEKNILFCSF